MEEEASGKYTLERAAVDGMYLVSEQNLFELREGDSPISSLDRLLPDFYQIFANNIELAYMRPWSLFETLLFIGPFAFILAAFAMLSISQFIQLVVDQLIYLSVSCSDICQHGMQISQQGRGSMIIAPMRLIQKLQKSDGLAQKAWGVMRLTKPDSRLEMMRHLTRTVRRIRDEKALLHKRRSIIKEAPINAPETHEGSRKSSLQEQKNSAVSGK